MSDDIVHCCLCRSAFFYEIKAWNDGKPRCVQRCWWCNSQSISQQTHSDSYSKADKTGPSASIFRQPAPMVHTGPPQLRLSSVTQNICRLQLLWHVMFKFLGWFVQVATKNHWFMCCKQYSCLEDIQTHINVLCCSELFTCSCKHSTTVF